MFQSSQRGASALQARQILWTLLFKVIFGLFSLYAHSVSLSFRSTTSALLQEKLTRLSALPRSDKRSSLEIAAVLIITRTYVQAGAELSSDDSEGSRLTSWQVEHQSMLTMVCSIPLLTLQYLSLNHTSTFKAFATPISV